MITLMHELLHELQVIDDVERSHHVILVRQRKMLSLSPTFPGALFCLKNGRRRALCPSLSVYI
jgi:hypothetical protein